MRHFDLCVIGSGPAGQKAAIQAAKLGKKVCVVEKKSVVGGAAINTGTIPSKSLREAILHMVSGRRLGPYTDPYSGVGEGGGPAGRDSRIQDLITWCSRVISAEVEVATRALLNNEIALLRGRATFEDAKTVRVEDEGGRTEILSADHFVVAVGTTPARPSFVPFDGVNVVDSDALLKMPRLPRSIIVVGGGVIGTEYASMLQALGVRTTLIEGKTRLLDFLDSEISEALQYHLRQAGMTLRMGEKVVKIEVIDTPEGARSSDDKMAQATLESGKTLVADCLLFCIGRQGATEGLNLEKAGLHADDRGRIQVNERYQTDVAHIYAAGDVIGFPALASTSMEQGRVAACHMFGERVESVPNLFPYGIYAIPEISMVGWTEDQLTKEGIPFEAGIAQYKEIARSQLMGDETGMLKILIHTESRVILGVHVIGAGATELIHIGQAVMAFKGTVDYFINAVFNYPTLAECYKVAAFNGANKLRHV
ncbi:MAG: Si-specific NAD(P)(+) transhydrogenase [Phycisphaerales bacterium]|nr:Si-specific NAD(P)(+) transhydrogenase [Phycisphaerales bacterium]